MGHTGVRQGWGAKLNNVQLLEMEQEEKLTMVQKKTQCKIKTMRQTQTKYRSDL